MRLAARAPPPPILKVGRLLQLLAFSRLQGSYQMFDVCVFACVQFVHISEVICMFLKISVDSFRARRLLAAKRMEIIKGSALPADPKNMNFEKHPKNVKK